MTRPYIHKIKDPKAQPKFSIIILGAGLGTRINGESKPLLKMGGETVIKRQLRLLKAKYGAGVDITFVGGYKYAEVISHIKDDCKIVINERYNETNVAYSLFLGLLATNHRNCLVVYGDLIFDYDALPSISDSSLLVVDDHQMKKEEIGVIVQSRQAVNMLYEPKTKWCQIGYFTPEYTTPLFDYCRVSSHHKHFGYEAINHLLSEVGAINTTQCGGKINEIDLYKDLEEARIKFHEGHM